MSLSIRQASHEIVVDVETGTTLLQALQHAGVSVDAPCGGHGTCKKCRVLVQGSDGVNFKLACQTPADDGLVVVAPNRSEMVIEQAGTADVTDMADVVDAASEASAAGAAGASAQGRPWSTGDGDNNDTREQDDTRKAQNAPATSSAADTNATGFAVAIDVGTTTLVCRLYDLATGANKGSAGIANPQIAFGADVLSRITACSEGALHALQQSVVSELVSLITQLAHAAHIALSDITRIVLAGNTVMETIAAGIDPTPLGVAPFSPPALFGNEVQLRAFAQAHICGGTAFFAPCVTAYVGGDITCDLLALDMHHTRALTLMIDLGTNGEMALGNEKGIITCATAAGPVFEGACIKYGMPAYAGAISQVTFAANALGEEGMQGRIAGTPTLGEGAPDKDEQTRAHPALALTTVGDAPALGICGTGIIDVVALMLDHGLIDEAGAICCAEEVDPTCSCGLERFLGEEDGQPAFFLCDGIALTQKDVRQLQLAKAAICAGVRTLVSLQGCKLTDIDNLVIAGGFGSYLNLRNAARVGLFPAELLRCARSSGNLAIEGASAMSLSRAARDEACHIAASCTYVELSTSAAFNAFYVDEMGFEA